MAGDAEFKSILITFWQEVSSVIRPAINICPLYFFTPLEFKIVRNRWNNSEKRSQNSLCLLRVIRVLLECNGVSVPPVIYIIYRKGPFSLVMRMFFALVGCAYIHSVISGHSVSI